jgi:hypothetical protein
VLYCNKIRAVVFKITAPAQLTAPSRSFGEQGRPEPQFISLNYYGFEEEDAMSFNKKQPERFFHNWAIAIRMRNKEADRIETMESNGRLIKRLCKSMRLLW